MLATFGFRAACWGLALSFIVFFVACQRAEEPPAPAAALEATSPEPVPQSGASPQASASTVARMMTRRAELSLSSETVASTSDDAVTVVAEAGGYVNSREQRLQAEHVVESHLVLRVPAARFEETLSKLKQRARLVQERVFGEDVTEEFSDVEARLRAQRALEERLLGLLSATNLVKDLLEVERELARVRTEVERLTGRRDLLRNQIEFATIELRIQSPEQPVLGGIESVGSRIGNAFSDAMDLSVTVVTALIQLAGIAFPFIPVPIFFYVGYRLQRRRKALATQT